MSHPSVSQEVLDVQLPAHLLVTSEPQSSPTSVQQPDCASVYPAPLTLPRSTTVSLTNVSFASPDLLS